MTSARHRPDPSASSRVIRPTPLPLTEGNSDGNLSFTVFRLVTFGGLGIEADDGIAAPRLRPPRLALLAVLAAAGNRGMSRDKLAALFKQRNPAVDIRLLATWSVSPGRDGSGRD